MDVVFPAPEWEALRRHLFGARQQDGGSRSRWRRAAGIDEQLAFVLAGPVEGAGPDGCERLVAAEVIPAHAPDLEHRSAARIAPTGAFVAAALSRCRAQGWSLIEVHSHPFSTGEGTTFSGIDWGSDRAKMPAVARLLPAGARHVTMVMGPDSLDAHRYDPESGGIRPVREVSVVGAADGGPARVLRFTPTGARASAPSGGADPEGRFARQLPLFGRAVQERLAGTSVAVVGLGGLGSFAALELSHLGVGRLLLIDPDTVEPSNLNRLLAAAPADVGRPKAEVYAERVRAIAPRARVEAVAAPLLDAAAWRPASGADLLLGCVDGHGARLVLNRLAVQYAVPLLDGGSGVRLDGDGTVRAAGGQVQLVAPGVPCLLCREFIDARRAAYDLAPPEVRERERAHGYGTVEAAPSVVFLNGVVASMLVGEAVKLLSGGLHGRGAQDAPAAIAAYDLLRQSAQRAGTELDPACPVCGDEGVRGLADLAPLARAEDRPAGSRLPQPGRAVGSDAR